MTPEEVMVLACAYRLRMESEALETDDIPVKIRQSLVELEEFVDDWISAARRLEKENDRVFVVPAQGVGRGGVDAEEPNVSP